VEPTSTVSPVDAPARLSSLQKRDLLGHAFAAVITTGLIAAPLLTQVRDGMNPWAEAALPAQSFAAVVAPVAIADARASRVPRESSRPTGARVKARPASRLSTSPLTGFAPQPLAVGTSGTVRAAADVPAPAPVRKPLSRRLTGWLTGDGTPSVRPFPSVAGRP
jgi:hypothetical protein